MKLRISLLTTALFLMSSPAFATKAKLQALQGARFLTDSQLIFENPAQIHGLGNYLTFELGGTTATASPKSEGGIFKEIFGGRGGLYLGHMSQEQLNFRVANGFLTEENPVEFFYGKGNWAGSLSYSASDVESTSQKQTSIAARFGIDTGVMEAWVNAELIEKSENTVAGTEAKGAPLLTVGGEYHMDKNLYVNGRLQYGALETEAAGVTTDRDLLAGEVTLLDRSIKNDKAAIYYGPGFRYAEQKVGTNKVSGYSIPVFIGMEFTATSWLVARGSISQNFVLGKTKNETVAGSPNDTITNNTTVSTGIGINWNSLIIDATFAGSTTGQFNGNSILANLGLIYNF